MDIKHHHVSYSLVRIYRTTSVENYSNSNFTTYILINVQKMCIVIVLHDT